MKFFCCCILFLFIGKICIGQKDLTINYEYRREFGPGAIRTHNYWFVVNDSVSFFTFWSNRGDTLIDIIGKEKFPSQSLYRNYRTNKSIVQTAVSSSSGAALKSSGGMCRILDTIVVHKWKLVEGAQKTIIGYECSKATLIDEDGQRVSAWYTKDLPALHGPTRHDGLPGMVLQVIYESNNISITATSVSQRKVQVVEPTAGKLMTMEEYSQKNKEGRPFF
jgi:GLPGLI family protein